MISCCLGCIVAALHCMLRCIVSWAALSAAFQAKSSECLNTHKHLFKCLDLNYRGDLLPLYGRAYLDKIDRAGANRPVCVRDAIIIMEVNMVKGVPEKTGEAGI